MGFGLVLIGVEGCTGWVHEFFIKNSKLSLKLMSAKWRTAFEEAKLVSKILDVHGVSKGSSILEVGCGNGRIAINLAKLGYRVTGIDISPTYIEDAKRRSRELGVDVEFLVCDARELDRCPQGRSFDAIIFYWTSVLGYYDEDTDLKILTKCRGLVNNEGKLMILNHVNRDYLVTLFSTHRVLVSVMKLDEGLLIEYSKLDLTNSRYISRWRFYEEKGNDLVFLDELESSQRVYSIHELVNLAKKSGWEFVKAYADLRTLEEFSKPICHRAYNIIFRPT